MLRAMINQGRRSRWRWAKKTGMVSIGASIDADAQAYFNAITANGGTISINSKNAWNGFVTGAKADGWWNDLTMIIPFLGDQLAATQIAYRCDTATPVVMTLTNVVAGDYSEADGFKSNTNSKLFSAPIAITSDVGGTISHGSFSFGYYATTIASGNSPLGFNDTGMLLAPNYSGTLYANNESGTVGTTGYTQAAGWHLCNRTTGGSFDVYQNNVLMQNLAATGSMSVTTITVGRDYYGTNANQYTKFVYIGAGLNATKRTQMFNRMVALQTAIGRNA